MNKKQGNWVDVAKGEIGMRIFPEGSSNPRITEYHNCTNIKGYDDKAAWCSSFLNWVFTNAGFQGTGSALARSWLDWGEPLAEPIFGCVVVLEREAKDSWQGHVGLFLSTEEDKVSLLGGNQLGEVRIHTYPISTVLGFRWPA
jgi:uncharacterized protein (TIGR02594 family)